MERNEILEKFAEAYLAQINLSPKEIRMIEIKAPNKTSWHFEPIDPEEKTQHEIELEIKVESLQAALRCLKVFDCWCPGAPHSQACLNVRALVGSIG